MTDNETTAPAAPAPVATIQKAEAAHLGLLELIDHLELGEQKLVAEAKAEIEKALKAVETAIEHLTGHLETATKENA